MTAQKQRDLRQWFEAEDQDRFCALDRKREHSMLSIPSILPWEGRAVNTQLEVPYDSTVADGVNALSSRIASVVFPLNGQSVFEIDNSDPFNPAGQDDSDMDEAMERFARYTMKTLAPTNLRAQINLVYNHLIVTGDVLIHQLDNFNFRLFRADQYVVRRMHEGDWVDVIIKEQVNPEWHPDLAKLPKDGGLKQGPNPVGEEQWECLYTHVHKDPDTGVQTVTQEFRGNAVGKPKTREVPNYFPARWKGLIGESQGISFIEDNFGDVRTIDAMAKALLDGTLLNAEYRWGVNPAGITELQDMLDSRNGDFVPTAPGDVFPLQFQNAAQVQATSAAVAQLQERLRRKFLQFQARNAERVTSVEIQRTAQDLEASLGGVLSMSSNEVQDPIIRSTLFLMGEKNMIPKAIASEIKKADGLVKLRIRAGLEILNREAEREKLDGAIERVRNLPPQAHEAIIWTAVVKDWWASMGLETAGRVKSAEQLAQERAEAQQAALAQQAAQAGVQAGVQQQQQAPAPE
jgi:hypothetical protein